ncbi:response regulator [Thioclava sp. SK-1]|uniref:response regulator n=1 Tax=Thioclava sp. SK-1 TaxID=1889770 RepID=UPI0008241779|nr:response regulator [Thioclava sp. SK-1]OCX66919.1 response regulator [Thioclava sp. SK-1]
MSDDVTGLLGHRHASAARPLLGLTVLVVEDSRYASEAMRLLCLRSGARIRRADCLRSAHRHLQTYRPSVVIVDLGLPDGSGADLIEAVKKLGQAMPAVLGTSGDIGMETVAYAAGADGFLPKPVESLALFQQAVLAVLPQGERPIGVTVAKDDHINPDPIALRDDLNHMAEVLSQARDPASLGYVAQFLSGVARSAHDEDLENAAAALVQAGGASDAQISRLSVMVNDRIDAGSLI